MGPRSRTYRVSGGGGVVLFVEETGNPGGRPVLFLHGFSQCRLAWERQLRSDLGRDLRLVAMDLRGHGLSEKPRDGYGDGELWAADVHAVITTLELDRPILCGWSYGGVVVGDYLSRYGEAAVGGVALVGAASRLGEPALPFFGANFLATLPGLFSTDLEASTAALRTFIHLTTSADPAPEDLYLTLGYNIVVPPHVRQAMLSRTLTHDGLLKELTTPVLVAHGSDDEIVLPGHGRAPRPARPPRQDLLVPGHRPQPFLEVPDQFTPTCGRSRPACERRSRAGAPIHPVGVRTAHPVGRILGQSMSVCSATSGRCGGDRRREAEHPGHLG